MAQVPLSVAESAIKAALREDLPNGDVTTVALIPPQMKAEAQIIVRERGVSAGIEMAALVFHRVDPDLQFHIETPDGKLCSAGQILAKISGTLASILVAERTALNFMQRMSGIATLTSKFVESVGGHSKIVDTRKTAPGLRALDKYAVLVGGGHNHRFGLSDGVLIKDNHIAALTAQGMSIREIVTLARDRVPHTLKIEVEVDTVDAALETLHSGADAILLDNMTPQDMRKVTEAAKGMCILEASGRITLDNVAEVAKAGVDIISVGAPTHSAPALDISLEVLPRGCLI